MPGADGPRAALARIKLLHTAVWAFFAGCILALPVASWQGRHRLAAGLAAVVAMEVLVLALNLLPLGGFEQLTWFAVPIYTLMAMKRVYGGRWWPRWLRAATVSTVYLVVMALAMTALTVWAALA